MASEHAHDAYTDLLPIIQEGRSQGATLRTIADQLNISVRTVEGHFSSIFTKLGVSSRIEAVLYALSHHAVTLAQEEAK